jgi:hypothetical protein
MRSSSYGKLEQWLHWLALEPAVVRQLAFDLERSFVGTQPPSAADGSVYVCGLARSGTTMLLRILDQPGDFQSLAYRDMPFVLAPNLWRRITQYFPRSAAPAERAHGDGILVDFDSPEGFEEVFWRTFGGTAAPPYCVGCDDPSAETLAAFAEYRAMVTQRSAAANSPGQARPRYLSKNNNNLLRLHSLSMDPTATLLLVYRDPLSTARSSLRQHQRFCASQRLDPFSRRYMGWLSHHEFGLDHRPLCFAVSGMNPAYEPSSLDYWLDYWNAVYQHVLAQPGLRLHLLNHGALCADPARSVQALFELLGVRGDVDAAARLIVPPAAISPDLDGVNHDLLGRAQATHRALLASPKNLFRDSSAHE